MLGDAGLARMSAMTLSARNREDAQDVQDEIAKMSSEGINDTARIADELANMASSAQDGDTASIRFKAMATELAGRGGEGKKALAKIMRQGGAGAKMLADYAATGDSNVLSAIGDKDAYAQQYARSLASGTTSEGDFKTWLNGDSGHVDSNNNKMSNLQFVTDSVLDDNERLMSQSGDAVDNALSAKDASTGESMIGEDRAESILSDPALVKNKPKNAAKVKKALLPHGVVVEKGATYSVTKLNIATGKNETVSITGRRMEDGTFIAADGTNYTAQNLVDMKATKVN